MPAAGCSGRRLFFAKFCEMKAAAILTGAESGVPCPTNEALGRPSKAVAEAAPTAAATVRKLAAALSWRAPLVLIPYLW